MNKEKQIEEMARVLAEVLYNANYRKQSEGEWKVEEFYNSGLRMHFGTNITCSCCGYTERKGSAYFTPSNFCPNCGAKMKGGE